MPFALLFNEFGVAAKEVTGRLLLRPDQCLPVGVLISGDALRGAQTSCSV